MFGLTTPSKRGRSQKLVAGLAALALSGGVLGLVTANTASAASSNASGLIFKSGAGVQSMDHFADFRGRKLDVGVTWNNAPDFNTMQALNTVDQYKGKVDLLSFAQPLVPEGGSLAQCAAGNYDGNFTTIGKNLAAKGFPNADVRLGWEFNGTWYRWQANDAAAFKGCFSHASKAFKAASSAFTIDFNGSGGHQSKNVGDLYPGDDVVDVIGIDWYDAYPAKGDKWDVEANAGTDEKPEGLIRFMNFAKAHGKKLALPEWGIDRGDGGGGFDDPDFITKTAQFLMDNASNVYYEAYYNIADDRGGNIFLITDGFNPKASAAYLEYWGKNGKLAAASGSTDNGSSSNSSTTTAKPAATTTTVKAAPGDGDESGDDDGLGGIDIGSIPVTPIEVDGTKIDLSQIDIVPIVMDGDESTGPGNGGTPGSTTTTVKPSNGGTTTTVKPSTGGTTTTTKPSNGGSTTTTVKPSNGGSNGSGSNGGTTTTTVQPSGGSTGGHSTTTTVKPSGGSTGGANGDSGSNGSTTTTTQPATSGGGSPSGTGTGTGTGSTGGSGSGSVGHSTTTVKPGPSAGSGTIDDPAPIVLGETITSTPPSKSGSGSTASEVKSGSLAYTGSNTLGAVSMASILTGLGLGLVWLRMTRRARNQAWE